MYVYLHIYKHLNIRILGQVLRSRVGYTQFVVSVPAFSTVIFIVYHSSVKHIKNIHSCVPVLMNKLANLASCKKQKIWPSGQLLASQE
jgi:hypothetical protein